MSSQAAQDVDDWLVSAAPFDHELLRRLAPGLSALSETPELQLVAMAGGDSGAFANIYEEMAPRVYGLALRILRDSYQAQEVTQDVFLQVWETADRFDPQRGSAFAWLMTIAHHKAVDRVRRIEGSHRRDVLVTHRSHQTPFDETATAATAALGAHTVRAALGALSGLQRQGHRAGLLWRLHAYGDLRPA